MKRFFQDRNFYIVRPHNLKDKGIVLHRTAMKSLWKGDKPTPNDLVSYLADPPSVAADKWARKERGGDSVGDYDIIGSAAANQFSGTLN